MKKKVLASVLAGSLALGGYAWMPPVGSGGTSHVVRAAVPDIVAEYVDPVWQKLTNEEKGQVSAVWTSLRNSLNGATADDIVNPLYDALHDATGGFAGGGYEYINDKASLARFVLGWTASDYNADGAFLENWRLDPEVRGVARELAGLAGVSPAAFSFQDAEATVEALQQAIGTVLSDTNLVWDLLTEFLTPGGESGEIAVVRSLAKRVLEEMMRADGDLALVKLIEGIEANAGVSQGVMADALIDSFVAMLDTHAQSKQAVISLFAAAIRANAELVNTTANGNQLTLRLSLFDAEINNAFISWTSNSSAVSINNGVATYSGSSSATVGVTASVLVPAGNNVTKIIYEGNITFNITPPAPGGGTGGGGTGGGDTPPATSAPGQGGVQRSEQATQTLQQVSNRLNELAAQANNASEAERRQLIKEAKQAVKQAVKELTKLDVSAAVVVTDGKATPTLNKDAIVQAVRAIKAELAALNAQLKQLDPNAQEEKLVARLSLGNVDAAAAEIPLSSDLLAELSNEGVEAIAIEVNGVSVALPTAELGGGATLTVNEEDAQAAGNAANLPTRSSVYTFNLTVSGTAKDRFDEPVRVEIPVNAAGADIDLLALARLENNTFELHGGTVVDGVLVAERRTFSTYTVVENSVEFNDIASVAGWAGRAIEVAAAKGIVQGKGGGAFDPEGDVTRAEFAKMIAKSFFLEDGTLTETFTDVNASDWFQTYVAVASKHGIVNGRTLVQFAPHDKITREELATMISRAMTNIWGVAAAADTDGALAGFSDASSIDAVHRAGVALVVEQGLMIGYDGKFNPDGYATRAEAAVVIQRILDAYAAQL